MFKLQPQEAQDSSLFMSFPQYAINSVINSINNVIWGALATKFLFVLDKEKLTDHRESSNYTRTLVLRNLLEVVS